MILCSRNLFPSRKEGTFRTRRDLLRAGYTVGPQVLSRSRRQSSVGAPRTTTTAFELASTGGVVDARTDGRRSATIGSPPRALPPRSRRRADRRLLRGAATAVRAPPRAKGSPSDGSPYDPARNARGTKKPNRAQRSFPARWKVFLCAQQTYLLTYHVRVIEPDRNSPSAFMFSANRTR